MGQVLGKESSSLTEVGQRLESLSDDSLLRAAAAFLTQRPSLKQRLVGRLSVPLDFEEPEATSADDLASSTGITVVAFSTWKTPFMHCAEVKAGLPLTWSTPPGLAMPASNVKEFAAPSTSGSPGWYAIRFPSASKVEFLLNDGGSNWQKAAFGANFVVDRPGLWILRDGRLVQHVPGASIPVAAAASGPPKALPCATGDPLEIAKTEGGIIILYQTKFARPHLHFRSNGGPWTAPPGQAMSMSSLSGYPSSGGWWALHLPDAPNLDFVPNDGGSQWDKLAGGDYKVSRAGAWRLSNGSLEPVEAMTLQPESITVQVPTKPSSTAPPLSQASVEDVSNKKLSELMKLQGLVIIYKSAWEKPHLHCRTVEDSVAGEWTQLPGLALKAVGSEVASELSLDGSNFMVYLPKVKGMEFVLNDGGPHFRWDKASGGSNFRTSGFGVYLVQGGRLDLVQPPPEAPQKPAVIAVTRIAATIAWNPVPTGVKGYRVFRNGKEVASLTAGVTRYIDSGLYASHEFRYSIAAFSLQGVLGERSGEVIAKTEAVGRPEAPMNLRIASAGGKGITLEWSPPDDNGGAPVTAYVISRDGKVSSTVLESTAATTGSKKLTWTDKDVEHGASYSYTLTACHLPPAGTLRQAVLKERQSQFPPEEHDFLLDVPEDLNESDPAGPVEARAVDELEVGECKESLREMLKPSQKEGVTVFYKSTWSKVHAHCCASEAIGWTQSPGLRLEPSTCHNFPSSEGWFVLCLPYARSLELVMTDGGREWDKAPGGGNYRVAIPGVLRLSAGQIEVVAMPPKEPLSLAAEALDGSRVRLTWKSPEIGADEAPISSYKVFRNGRVVGQTDSATSLTFEDINLFAFTDYEYSVAAVNRQEVSGPLSQPVQVKTLLPGPPSEPRNLRAGCKRENGKVVVLLEWEPPANCGGAPVSNYEILRNGTLVDVYEVPSAKIRSEAEAARPLDPEAAKERRWVRSSCSYSNLSWFKDALRWTDEHVVTGENYSYQVQAVQLGPERAEELKADGLVQRCGSRFLDNVLPDVVGPACHPAEVRATPFLEPVKLGEPKSVIMFQGFDWGSCKASSWYTVLLGLLPELRSAGINMIWLPPPSDSVDEHGYLPRKWYVLDNHYGKAAELQKLISSMHEQEIIPMLDVVVNHRCASAQDHAGRWLKFEQPDWEAWAVCCNSPAVPGGSGAPVTGEPAQYAPSVDHTNPKIRDDINAYIHHMMEEIGFRALRFDFVKGYAPRFQKDYVRAAGCPFAVAENWNGDVNGLQDYVRECQGLMAVYDFPLYYVLKRCIHSNNFEDLNCGGRLAGIAGRDPARACTFIDNHDTYQLAVVGGCFGSNEQVLRAYALILTHPGVPCVFHWDYVRAPLVREKLLQLCSIRRDAGIHSTSQLNICASGQGIYAAIIENKVAIKIGTNNWSPGGGWKVGCTGNEFCVWTRC